MVLILVEPFHLVPQSRLGNMKSIPPSRILSDRFRLLSALPIMSCSSKINLLGLQEDSQEAEPSEITDKHPNPYGGGGRRLRGVSGAEPADADYRDSFLSYRFAAKE